MLKFLSKIANLYAVCASVVIALSVSAAVAQSSDQAFPTPVTSNEINGTIAARDIGDPRLTTHYYTFDGTQGDVFINIVTENLNGDVDIFAADGLRSLTKVVVFADSSQNETGRVIYLRKPEKLILRVQGRTPGDDPATYRIKFAGSFAASTETDENRPELPSVRAENDSGIKVNSVGTIVAVVPKPTPSPAAAAVADAPVDDEIKSAEDRDKPEVAAAKPAETEKPQPEKKAEVVVSDNLPPKTTTPSRRTTARTRRTLPAATPKPAAGREKPPEPAKAPEEKPADPLANVRLVIMFKNGGKIERPLPEVLRFSVDRGVLTVVSKDGTVGRYQMVEVSKVTIE